MNTALVEAVERQNMDSSAIHTKLNYAYRELIGFCGVCIGDRNVAKTGGNEATAMETGEQGLERFVGLTRLQKNLA